MRERKQMISGENVRAERRQVCCRAIHVPHMPGLTMTETGGGGRDREFPAQSSGELDSWGRGRGHTNATY